MGSVGEVIDRVGDNLDVFAIGALTACAVIGVGYAAYSYMNNDSDSDEEGDKAVMSIKTRMKAEIKAAINRIDMKDDPQIMEIYLEGLAHRIADDYEDPNLEEIKEDLRELYEQAIAGTLKLDDAPMDGANVNNPIAAAANAANASTGQVPVIQQT